MDFSAAIASLRAEMHAHCYRMLGSVHDADDAVQEAMVRAWRGMATVRTPAATRSWMYAVTTRVCLDAIRQRRRRALPADLGPASPLAVTADSPDNEVAWLTPYPSGPGLRFEMREAVELAFVAALQSLPGNQRAALLLVEVLGFTPAEVATMMATTTASINSALQRARAASLPRPTEPPDAQARALAVRYADALQRGDADALVALLTEDVTWSMPPLRAWYAGVPAVRDFAERIPLGSCGRWQHRPTTANAQPAMASYLCAPGMNVFEAWSIDVLTVRDNRIAAITSFIGADHFTAFGLPACDGAPHQS